MKQEDKWKICAEEQINTKRIYCGAAAQRAARICVLHQRDAHKDLFTSPFAC